MSAEQPAARGIGWFLRALLPWLLRYRLASGLLLGALLVDLAFEALIPLSLKFLIDEAIVPHRLDRLVWVLTVLACGGLLVAASQIGRDYLYAYLGSHVLDDLRSHLYAHLQRLSIGFYARTGTGEIMARFSSDLASVENAIVLGLPAGIMSALGVVVSATILAVLDWRLALLALVGVPLCIIGPRLIGPHAARAGYRLKSLQARFASTVQEHVSAQPVIKAFGLGAVLQPRFRASADELRRTSARSNFLAYLVERTPNIGVLVFNLLLIGIGGYLTFRGDLTIGSLVSFQALFMTLASAMEGLTWVLPQLIQAAAGMQRIAELLDERPQVTDRPDAPPLARLARSIRFEDVTFGYVEGHANLERVSFEIPAGSFVAFVGASGSGKSTVLNLVLRFYDPAQGAVRFDGHDLREVAQASLRGQIGVVFQESLLFDTTVRENIRMGRPEASDAEVEAVARLAEIHEAVVAMPEGYDTPCGERGARLSGGQRQRVAIARALLRDPAVLVLDEATSALDPGAESAINATLDRLRAGRTVITVTHRLSAVTGADRIFVLHAGRLAESGTHAELLAAGGEYRSLWARQSGFSLSGEGDRAAITPARLRQLPMLADLGDELLAELAQAFGTELYAPGREVIREGDPGDRFYLVARGRLEVLKADAPDRVAVLLDGDHFGEIALLRNAPRNATVRTLTDATLLSLSRGQFSQLVERFPGVRARLDASLADRI